MKQDDVDVFDAGMMFTPRRCGESCYFKRVLLLKAMKDASH